MDLEWKIPDVWNAFEGNRGRAYHLAYVTTIAFDNWPQLVLVNSI